MKVRITATRNDEVEIYVEVEGDVVLDPTDDRWQVALYEARSLDVIERHFTVHEVTTDRR